MKKITRIVIIISSTLISLLAHNAYAQHSTSTPMTIALPNLFQLDNKEAAGSGGGEAQRSGTPAITWVSDGSNNNASVGTNWSTRIVPQHGDEVLFDASSSANCDWDLTVTLNSLTIDAGYTGTVTISTNTLTIAESHAWTNADLANNYASNKDNWSTNTVPDDGDIVVFNNATPDDCTWDINKTPSLFSINSTYAGTVTLANDLQIIGDLISAGGILSLNSFTLTVAGDLDIKTGGILDAGSSIIDIKGDWSNTGSFIPGTSTVILTGISQTVYGDTTFYNLIKTVTLSDTMYFEAGSTQTVLNNLTLQGANGNLLSLRSTVDGQPWYIDPQGPRSISYVDMKDSYNSGSTVVIILDSIDSGNNTNLHFGEDCL